MSKKNSQPATYFADPERATLDHISSEVQACLDDPVVDVLLESVQGHVMVLNEHRQFLAGNEELLSALGRTHPELVGLRPGEIYNCVHIDEGTDGCGTSRHCRTCGAILTILATSETHAPSEDECRLTMEKNGKITSTEFRVRCTPLQIGPHKLLVFILVDISNEKRRQVLERVFFHDILNTIGGLSGWSSVLSEMTEQSAAKQIVSLAERLKEVVYFQRDLTEAEAGTLQPELADHDVEELFNHLNAVFQVNETARDRKLVIEPPPGHARVHTDARLVLRVLINMVKNALEAVGETEAVTVRYRRLAGDRPVFEVHNPGVIPDVVREHIFERAYSTRGAGRGLGTYSMKLFGENCLGGTVDFESSDTSGTVFRLTLPAGTARGADPSHLPETIDQPEPGRDRRAMLVEGHPAVRKLTALYLKTMGYTPHAFDDPLLALRRLQEDEGAFDIVIVDVTLPAIPGDRFLELAREIRQDLPIVLSTPFAKAHIGIDNPPQQVAFLPKPYTKKDLVNVVQSLAG